MQIDPTVRLANAVLSRNAQRVLSQIFPLGAQHAGTIGQSLGLSCATVRRHADMLADAGLVEVRCFGARVPANVEVRDVIVTAGGACWTQSHTPTSAWIREGETDRKPGPNSYEFVRTAKTF